MMIGFEIGNSTTWLHGGSELWETYQSTSIMRCARGIFTWLKMMLPITIVARTVSEHRWGDIQRAGDFRHALLKSGNHRGFGVHNFLDTATIVVPTFGFDGFPSSC